MRELFRCWLPLACFVALTGCVLPFDQAPCTTDLECPTGQFCKLEGSVGKCALGAATPDGGGGATGGGGGATGGGGGATGGGGGATGGGGGATGGDGGATGGDGGATGGDGGATGGDGGATEGDGGVTGGDGGASTDGGLCPGPCSLSGPCACAIFDVRPPLAQVGDLITLEGRFHPTANTVVFPSGATATATRLSTVDSSRVQVQVPFDAGVGTLGLNAGSGTVAGPHFRTVTFRPGVGRFDDEFDQTAYGIAMPALIEAPPALTATALGGWLYVIGGSFVQRARINADDTLGPFVSLGGLASPRFGHTVQVLGSRLYVLGGQDLGGDLQAGVVQATIGADGTLGTFSNVTGVSLREPRSGHSSFIVGDGLYVVGGVGVSGLALDTVERAPIHSDGTLSAFEVVPGVRLQTARSHFGLAVSPTHVFVVGGRAGPGPTSTIEQASIGSGALGPFQASGTLTTAREAPLVMALNDRLTVFGGREADATGASLGTAESAWFLSTGISSFTPEPVSSFQRPRAGAAAAVVGNYVFAVGGSDGSTLASLERAPLNASGELSASNLVQSVVGSAGNGRPVVLGRKLYVVGAHPSGGVYQSSIDGEGRLGAFTVVTGSDTRVALPNGMPALREDPAIAVAEDQLWIMGGSYSSASDVPSATNSIVRFRLNGATLEQLPSTPFTLLSPRSGAAAISRGTWIHIVGGLSSGTSVTADTEMEAFNFRTSPLANSFRTTSKSLVVARAAMGRYVGRSVYVFGGVPGWTGGNVNVDEVAGWTSSSPTTPDTAFINSFAQTLTWSSVQSSPATAALGPWVYVMARPSGSLGTVLRSGFSATVPGELQGFTFLASGLSVPAVNGPHTALVLGNFLYYFAGNQVVQFELR